MDKENKIIIFDTNFLVSNTGKIKDIILKLESKGYISYIPQIVIEEYISIKLRYIKNTYKKLETLKNTNPNLQIKYKDEEKLLKQTEEAYLKIIKEVFKDNIIEYNEEEILKEVLKRNRFKEPPFYDETNSSDKGFKDTICWLSIKEFVLKHEELATFFYITSDNGFIKYKPSLENEISDNNLQILDIKEENILYEELNIEDKKNIEGEKNIFNYSEKNIDIDDIREKINTIMWSFNKLYEEDCFGNPCVIDRFELYNNISFSKAEEILNNIPVVIAENIFQKAIKVETLLKMENLVFEKGDGIEINTLRDLYNLYSTIQKTEHKEAFINFVMNKINENKTFNSTFVNNSDDELPF